MKSYNFIRGIINLFDFKMRIFNGIKTLFFCWAMCCLSTIVLAQGEFLNNSNSIAPKGSGLSSPKTFNPSVFSPSPKLNSNKPSSILEDKKLQFTQNNQFANPGDAYKEKLNKNLQEGGEDSKMFRKNQYFGDIKSKSEYVKVSCRDFGEVDGDEIRVLLNDRVVIDRIYLDSSFQGIQIPMQKGFNKIDFEALNQGTSGPNTAQFMIYDDKGQLLASNQWNLGTGFKASIIVIKD